MINTVRGSVHVRRRRLILLRTCSTGLSGTVSLQYIRTNNKLDTTHTIPLR